MDELELTVFDVLRAIVRGEGGKLNSAEWVGKALDAIAAHEQASVPPAAPDVPPAPPAVTVNEGGQAGNL